MSLKPKFATAEEFWRAYLSSREMHAGNRERQLYRLLPADPRCKICNSPFGGVGGVAMRLIGNGPWPKNPRFCQGCFMFLKSMPGGAEVELSMLFADVRGSTTLAERMTAASFSTLMNRFFVVASGIVTATDGAVEKFVGDQVAALYVPGWTGKDHARAAIEGAQRLLRATGHADPGGPWIPVGAGVHTGTAYVGTIGDAQGVNDFAALGDAPNITARLAAGAKAGEIFASEAACAAAGLDLADLERRDLELRGKIERVSVRVIRVGPSSWRGE